MWGGAGIFASAAAAPFFQPQDGSDCGVPCMFPMEAEPTVLYMPKKQDSQSIPATPGQRRKIGLEKIDFDDEELPKPFQWFQTKTLKKADNSLTDSTVRRDPEPVSADTHKSDAPTDAVIFPPDMSAEKRHELINGWLKEFAEDIHDSRCKNPPKLALLTTSDESQASPMSHGEVNHSRSDKIVGDEEWPPLPKTAPPDHEKLGSNRIHDTGGNSSATDEIWNIVERPHDLYDMGTENDSNKPFLQLLDKVLTITSKTKLSSNQQGPIVSVMEYVVEKCGPISFGFSMEDKLGFLQRCNVDDLDDQARRELDELCRRYKGGKTILVKTTEIREQPPPDSQGDLRVPVETLLVVKDAKLIPGARTANASDEDKSLRPVLVPVTGRTRHKGKSQKFTTPEAAAAHINQVLTTKMKRSGTNTTALRSDAKSNFESLRNIFEKHDVSKKTTAFSK